MTKSGSNTLSGARVGVQPRRRAAGAQLLRAADQPKPELKQNQFGAAFGGPLMRNRLFGFGYYEGYRNDSGITRTSSCCRRRSARGDFSGGAAIRDPLTGLPFAGNIIPADRISPAAAQLLSDFVPLPNSAGNRYIVSPTVNDVRDQFGVRFDYPARRAASRSSAATCAAIPSARRRRSSPPSISARWRRCRTAWSRTTS